MTTPAMTMETSRFTLLQQRISNVTWFITLLLSLRGLFTIYGMQQKGSAEQVVNFITEPIVQLFNFPFLSSLGEIPGIAVFFAVISLLLASYSLQIGIKYTGFRLNRTRTYVAPGVLSVK